MISGIRREPSDGCPFAGRVKLLRSERQNCYYSILLFILAVGCEVFGLITLIMI